MIASHLKRELAAVGVHFFHAVITLTIMLVIILVII